MIMKRNWAMKEISKNIIQNEQKNIIKFVCFVVKIQGRSGRVACWVQWKVEGSIIWLSTADRGVRRSAHQRSRRVFKARIIADR